MTHYDAEPEMMLKNGLRGFSRNQRNSGFVRFLLGGHGGGAEQALHLLSRITIAPFKQMAMGIHRQLDGRMAEPLRNPLWVHSLIDQQRGMRVSQVIAPELWESVI